MFWDTPKQKKILDLPLVGDAAASYLERQADHDILFITVCADGKGETVENGNDCDDLTV